tara:strand:+ start:336 stop:563 length:228 start_codon:yes stop_codon:yes gene_type:complete
MRISNKYDMPSVSYKGVNYFPQDKSELTKINGEYKKTIQGIKYTRGKLRQDTYYICPNLFIELQTYLLKHLKEVA